MHQVGVFSLISEIIVVLVFDLPLGEMLQRYYFIFSWLRWLHGISCSALPNINNAPNTFATHMNSKFLKAHSLMLTRTEHLQKGKKWYIRFLFWNAVWFFKY